MTTAISPVTPLIPVSPISAFDNRNVLVPLRAVNNEQIQKALEENGGNKPSNADLFESELERNRNVAVPLAETNAAVQAALEESEGNIIDNVISTEDENDERAENIAQSNSIRNFVRERIINGFRDDELIPFNDNISAFNVVDRINEPSGELSLESVVTIQENLTPAQAPVFTQPVNLQSNPFNIYSHIINALQGGANEYQPFTEFDHNLEFEV